MQCFQVTLPLVHLKVVFWRKIHREFESKALKKTFRCRNKNKKN